MKTKISIILTTLLLSSSAVSAQTLQEKAFEAGLKPIPTDKEKLLKLIGLEKDEKTKQKVLLGQKLFFDPRLSKSGLISCNTCHNIGLGGVDGVEVAIGDQWKKNPHDLNSPTVYNAVFNKRQFWDGRSPNLEDQAAGPIQATPEMAATPEHVENIVNTIPAYLEAFRAIKDDNQYKPGIKDVADAIAKYERILVTPSRYDLFLNGNEDMLDKKEKEGLKIFIDKGCVSCHSGINLGGDMSPFPVVNPYKYASGDFKGDKNGMVKVPTLRNIAQTKPYFHNGKIWTLREAINVMADTQLGITLTKEENSKIESFLRTLDGQFKTSYPILPERGENSNKPIN